MAREKVVVVCPGRGTYNAPELGYLARYHSGAEWLGRFDAMREGDGEESLAALDARTRFDPSVHARGENAAPLIHACAWLDFLALDRERFEVVAVTGNSMGWYTALACAGAVGTEQGFAIARAMGRISGLHEPGGQAVLVLADEQWRVAPGLAEQVRAAMARHGVVPSIHLGGILVVAGSDEGLDALERDLPQLPRPPLRLAGNGPFHTPLMAASARAAREQLAAAWFGQPQVPLIDGTGRIWHRCETIPDALWDYTFGAQILEPYDFTRAIAVALREFAPDRLILTGPGETLGGAIGQIIVALEWLGLNDKAGFASRQEGDPFLLAMARPDQRALATGAWVTQAQEVVPGGGIEPPTP